VLAYCDIHLSVTLFCLITGIAASAATTFGTSPSEDDDALQVKLGDASLAASFTAKKPSIQSAVDVIRQVTLISTALALRLKLTLRGFSYVAETVHRVAGQWR
jgi:hypothetical protein